MPQHSLPPTHHPGRLGRRLRLGALAVLALAAPISPASAASTGTLRLVTMQLKPTFDAYMTGVLGSFERAHPGWKVEWTDVPVGDMESKTLTAIAAGDAPDLVNLNTEFGTKLASQGALALPSLTPAQRKAYFPGAWEACSWQGKPFAIPWYLSTSVTLYNGELWKAAGLKAGAWPRTWAALGARARAIHAKTGRYGFMPHFGDRGQAMEILAGEGVPLRTPDGAHAAFVTPKGVAAIAFWAGLFHDGMVPREGLTASHREAIDRFQAGQTAAFPAGPQFLLQLKANAPQLYAKLDLGPQITGAGRKMALKAMDLAVPRASRHPKEALALALHLASAESQLAFAKVVPILPSAVAATRDPLFKAGPGADLARRALALSARQLMSARVLVSPMPHEPELAKALDTALQKAALGRASAREALEEAARAWDGILAKPSP